MENEGFLVAVGGDCFQARVVRPVAEVSQGGYSYGVAILSTNSSCENTSGMPAPSPPPTVDKIEFAWWISTPVSCTGELMPRVSGQGVAAEFMYMHHPQGASCKRGNSGAAAFLTRPGVHGKTVHLGKLSGGQYGETGVAGFPIVGVGRHIELTAILPRAIAPSSTRSFNATLQLTCQHGNYFQGMRARTHTHTTSTSAR